MEGQGAVNRPAFLHDLVPSWIGAVDGLIDRLSHGSRIADLACGVGWASIAMAQQIPGASVIGWDTDAGSIETARRNAAAAGVDVRFELANAAAMDREGPFDLVTILEALHDMANPVEVLRSARSVLSEHGLVLVADEKVADEFTAPGDELGQAAGFGSVETLDVDAGFFQLHVLRNFAFSSRRHYPKVVGSNPNPRNKICDEKRPWITTWAAFFLLEE